MLILEGPDGGGKTTLLDKIVASGLCNHYGGASEVIHSPGPLRVGLYDWAIGKLASAHDYTIFDRFPYFSESVYGPALRKMSLMTPTQFISLGEWLRKKEPLVIYCRPPLEVILESSRVEEQMAGVLNNLGTIVKGYDQSLIHWAGQFRTYQYDFTISDADERFFTALREYIREDYKRGGWE